MNLIHHRCLNMIHVLKEVALIKKIQVSTNFKNLYKTFIQPETYRKIYPNANTNVCDLDKELPLF